MKIENLELAQQAQSRIPQHDQIQAANPYQETVNPPPLRRAPGILYPQIPHNSPDINQLETPLAAYTNRQ